jgi:hypothetical protein
MSSMTIDEARAIGRAPARRTDDELAAAADVLEDLDDDDTLDLRLAIEREQDARADDDEAGRARGGHDDTPSLDLPTYGA